MTSANIRGKYMLLATMEEYTRLHSTTDKSLLNYPLLAPLTSKPWLYLVSVDVLQPFVIEVANMVPKCRDSLVPGGVLQPRPNTFDFESPGFTFERLREVLDLLPILMF